MPASLLLTRVFCMFLPQIQKTRDNEREAGPDMISFPPPIVAQIFGFFGFFWFSRWFCYAFGKGPLVFLVFLVFPMDLRPLCVGPSLAQTWAPPPPPPPIVAQIFFFFVFFPVFSMVLLWFGEAPFGFFGFFGFPSGFATFVCRAMLARNTADHYIHYTRTYGWSLCVAYITPEHIPFCLIME